MKERVRKMLSYNTWAVVGATDNPEKFGYKIYKKLKRFGYTVYPVNPRYERVDGDVCYPDLASLPEPVQCVDVVVPPKLAEHSLDAVKAAGIPNIWFQPGTYTPEIVKRAEALGLNAVFTKCVLVELDRAIETVVDWLGDQVAQSHTKGLLVGLSGGIDSAVVGCLIQKACPDNALGVMMPCYSSEKDAEDAHALAQACGLKTLTVDLTETHKRLYAELGDGLSEAERGNRMVDANMRARLRMTTLYAIANAKNYLVVGTDNAAELLTGYFTKYGDGGADILPLGNLLKRDVYRWAHALDVPRSILDRKPSAGLWEGQTDEGEMGVTYDAIDAYIRGDAVSDSDREIIERLNRVSEHKRHTPPIPER